MKLIVPVMLAAVVVMAAQTAEPVAVAFYNIRAGQGIQPLYGHAALFVDGHNCTEDNKPRNAWGAGIAIERFGMPAPGEAAPSDHVGIVATFR